VPARGRDLAVFAITRTSASPTRLLAWTREIDQLYRGRYMSAMGRFSSPPRIEDLSSLTLEGEDLEDLRTCRPGDCGVKLGAGEMVEIRAAAAAAGRVWKGEVQQAFRQVILARAQQYVTDGLAAAPAYHDRKSPVAPDAEFAEAAARIGIEPFDIGHPLPYFHAFPRGEPAGVESFLYWSKETIGGGKPIVSITHVAIFREGDSPMSPAAVAARQVYASHYLTASLSYTFIAGGLEEGPRYLVYVRRARTDAFEGAFGRWIRSIVERRIRSDAPPIVDALRQKLESGDPPVSDASE
jgi:hypothetical protein